MKNVYDDPSYKSVQNMMHKRLLEIRAKYGESDLNDQHFKSTYLKSINK